MNQVNVRRAHEEDSLRIWEIRNHPDIRKVSNNTGKIEFENHDNWFQKKYFYENNNFCFIADYGGEIVGYCRFDHKKEQDVYIVSIAIDPGHHGKRFGGYLLAGAIAQAAITKNIIAQVFKENIISAKLFLRNGFEIYKEDENVVFYVLNNKL